MSMRWFSESEILVRKWRAMQWLYHVKLLRPLARLIEKLILRSNSCCLSPLATIGRNLKLEHPVGLVVGHGVVIGDNVTIYQHVTLGSRSINGRACPMIEDDVVIYAGAVVIGGVRLGKGAIVGANSVVTRDIAAGQVVYGNPAKVKLE